MKKIKRKLISGIAFFLAVILIINAVLVSAAQVRIQKSSGEDPFGLANNYLIDNTEYISKDTFDRMNDVIQMYMMPSTWQEYEEQAGIFIAQEKYDKALESISKSIDLGDGISNILKAGLWLQKGCLHTLLEEYDEAIHSLETCVECNPEKAEAYLILAQIYAEKGNADKTLSYMESYLELEPGNAEAEEMIAQNYMANEDYENAKKWYKAVQESSGSAQSYYYYGLCSIQTNDYKNAEVSLTKAIEIDDFIGDAYYYRGICKLTEGEYESALTDLKIAVERTKDENLRIDIQKLINELESIT